MTFKVYLLDYPMNKNSFSEKCYELLSKVPKGKITTYKSIAEALGTKAYRAVGTAMNKNPYAPQVPCHRVINSNGEVGGFAERLCGRGKNVKSITRARSRASGTQTKIKLLKSEGIPISNNKVQDVEKYLYKFQNAR